MPSVPPARSRRILSNASASDLLRRSRPSSCVNSPMAKYASCSRAHGPQKATPRISTSARRGQGLSVLLCTWQGTCFAIASVKETPIRKTLDRFFEDVARAEGGNLLGRDLHLLSGPGVSSLPGLALLYGELPEARDLDLLASLERFGHHLLEGLEVLLSLALGYPSFLCDPFDELLLLHGRSFLWSSSASRRAYLGCLPSCLYGSMSPCHPLAPGGFSGTDVVGAFSGRCPHIWHKHLGKAPG